MKSSAQQYIRDNSVWVPFCGCWLWIKSCNNGYGQTSRFGELTAHRLSYKTFKGQVPKGLWVLHTCDTPPCVNPDHLFLGTDADNKEDARRKNRFARGARLNHKLENLPKGERNGMARLTDNKVRQIFVLREAGHSQNKIGKIVGCSQSTVFGVLHRETWKHL